MGGNMKHRKHNLLAYILGAYLVFVTGIFLFFLLFGIRHPWLQMAVTLALSLIPLLVFWFMLYRPLEKIIRAASQSAADHSSPNLEYSGDDELGQLNTALNYLAESVNSSRESQRKFISNISHDFRSPLTSIKGYVEAILDGTIPVEVQEKYLHIVVSETERLNKLTEGLLTLNTFDDQGVYLDLTSFDLVPVITDTIAAFEGLSQAKNIRIRSSFTAPSIMVCADMARIQQVLYNLVDNAIKFSYNDSEILIRANNNQRKRVFVSVKDNGEGISRENLPRIWNRFFKTDASRGRDKKGTGLGLSIVKEIIRAHDQNIDVISTEGVGSEFIFTLSKPD